MLRVNLSDGNTLRLDLEHPDDLDEWKSLVNKETFQRSIRGASIHREGACYTLPLPQRFGDSSPQYAAELIWDKSRDRLAAERISCYIANVRIDLTVYASGSPPMARIDLTRVGRRRHAPPASSLGVPEDSTHLRGGRSVRDAETQQRGQEAHSNEEVI